MSIYGSPRRSRPVVVDLKESGRQVPTLAVNKASVAH